MSEKTKNLFQEIGDVFKKIWNYIVTAWQWFMVHRAVMYVGIVITVVASFCLAIELITALLLLGDPHQAEAIIQVFTGVSIFSYVTFYEYFAFVLGGAMFELALLTLLLWLGIWMWCGQNYFVKPRGAWFYVMTVAMFGLGLMMASVYYVTPEIMRLGQEMHRDYHHNQRAMYIDLDDRYEYYYPNENEYRRAQIEAERIRQQIEQQMQDQFDRVWNGR